MSGVLAIPKNQLKSWTKGEVVESKEASRINKIIKGSWVNTDLISDWYHTFWELYKHRIHLFIALCKTCTSKELVTIIKSKLHNDHSEFEWWFIIQMKTEFWQISYHLPNEYWDICNFITTTDIADERDWHTSDDVLERLLKL